MPGILLRAVAKFTDMFNCCYMIRFGVTARSGLGSSLGEHHPCGGGSWRLRLFHKSLFGKSKHGKSYPK